MIPAVKLSRPTTSSSVQRSVELTESTIREELKHMLHVAAVSTIRRINSTTGSTVVSLIYIIEEKTAKFSKRIWAGTVDSVKQIKVLSVRSDTL